MSRIAATFARLRAERRLAVIAYLTVGYPRPDATPSLVEAAARSGADAIELGIPFSDPLADGRTIQATSQVALKGGMTVARALEAARAARATTDVPLLFMTYLNPILAFGLERFCRAASDAGIDGLIVPDLPPTESADLRRAADATKLDLVFFVAPTSSEVGIEAACRAATGFVYGIAVTGVTGARAHLDEGVLPLIASVRRHTTLPVVVGFGISKPEHLAALEGLADGVIVASALLDAIARSPQDPATQVSRFLRELRSAPAR
ncbi:MAG: tryptophan synthase subunit alpha [Chloroflexota bacterium]|nr:MAG: tryptophan synthase subunit alpha [Chloroflexota bacterium]TMD84279.1 MAG: tryptophan synthase subunit alpha [Chloroflexota bacterium]